MRLCWLISNKNKYFSGYMHRQTTFRNLEFVQDAFTELILYVLASFSRQEYNPTSRKPTDRFEINVLH